MASSANYRKINKQMKFQFLSRVLGQNQPVYDVAKEIGIHYSTAKTIIFFHRHAHKSYQAFKLQSIKPQLSSRRAHYKKIEPGQQKPQDIAIVMNTSFFRWQPRKQVKAGNIELTYLRNSRPLQIKIHPINKPSPLFTCRPKSYRGSVSARNKGDSQKSSSEQVSDSEYVCTQ